MTARTWRPLLGWIVSAVLAFAVSDALHAQPVSEPGSPALLIADQVNLAGPNLLVATGNVEVFADGQRLTASEIRYDGEQDRIEIVGPLTLDDGSGVVILASSAELDTGFANGILRSARIVLNEEVQLAAAEIQRSEGRYNQLYKTVASSCDVCGPEGVPLWQIRSNKVIHDTDERRIYYENAFFEVAGVPVFYFPRLRIPDPTVERATGFLTPSVRTTDQLGFGMKFPYFIALAPDKDLTLTPYIAANDSRTLEVRYRQAFRTGRIEFEGAITRDELRPEDIRSYGVLFGAFALPRDYLLSFDLEGASDSTYLIDYDYNGAKDRLDSAIGITRTQGLSSNMSAGFIGYESLREGDDNSTLPSTEGRGTWEWRRPAYGGTAHFVAEVHGFLRDLEEDRTGRDVTRFHAETGWRRSWVSANGLIAATDASLRLDYTIVEDDSSFEDTILNLTPSFLFELRWPFQRQAKGGTDVLEPIVQLAWTSEAVDDTPREESTLLELDEGNLFSLTRFPANDQIEQGLRANVGVRWSRALRTGQRIAITVGRIFRQEDLGQFAGYDILEGASSDMLAAASLSFPSGVTALHRTLFDPSDGISRSETRLGIGRDRYSFQAGYSWLSASPVEDRFDEISEITFDGVLDINDLWRTDLGFRYDLVLDRTARAAVGIEYQGDCTFLRLGAERRFTSTGQLEPATTITVDFGLAGFGGERRGPPRSCNR